MNKLYILIGIPASGKSTLCNHISSPDPGVKIISRDEIRQLYISLHGERNETAIKKCMLDVIRYHLREGKDVYVDATNTFKEKRKIYKELIIDMKNEDREIEYNAIIVETPLELCIERNMRRSNDKVDESDLKYLYDTKEIPSNDEFDNIYFIKGDDDLYEFI